MIHMYIQGKYRLFRVQVILDVFLQIKRRQFCNVFLLTMSSHYSISFTRKGLFVSFVIVVFELLKLVLGI